MKLAFCNTNGLPIYQYLATLTANLSIICCGTCFAWPSPFLPQLLRSDSYIHITDGEGSWIAAVLFLGIIVGALLDGVILDRFGRKKVILAASILFIVTWIMVAYAQSVELLLVARFMAGIADGVVFNGTCIYLSEISDPKIRGFTGSSIGVNHLFGMVLINAIGSYLSITITALVSTIIPVLPLLTFSWLPESPYYFIMKGNMEEARRSLRIFKGTNDVEEELNRLTQAIAEQNSNTGKYLDLLTVKSNRKALFMLIGLRAAEQLCGASPVLFYAQVIFKETGNDVSPTLLSIIFFTAQLIISIFSSVIVDKIGRRPLLIFSLSGATVALLIKSCCFYIKNIVNIEIGSITVISIVALIFYVIMYSIGMLTIPVLVGGEVFPTNVRSFAVSIIDVYFCVLVVIVSKFFQFTKDEYGLHVPFIVFTVCGFLGVLFITFFVPETNGKTLEEIQEELKDVKKNSKCDNS